MTVIYWAKSSVSSNDIGVVGKFIPVQPATARSGATHKTIPDQKETIYLEFQQKLHFDLGKYRLITRHFITQNGTSSGGRHKKITGNKFQTHNYCPIRRHMMGRKGTDHSHHQWSSSL
ncbi:hypothetical protein [Neorhizobium galegae]|uniref:hypothetical protein n=1 Tax=Neorhizobium galegae TaxID=399 RepID=UPI001AE4642C|nr:hypothetical protein [Neorhizobium galegae]